MQRSDTKAKKNLYHYRNPVAKAREHAGFTQANLAAVAGITKTAVTNLEAGIIKDVPISVLDLLDPTFDGEFTGELAVQYHDWIAATRKANSIYLHSGIERLLSVDSALYGSWVGLRVNISSSTVGFCKLFCLHPYVLNVYEKGLPRDNFTKGMAAWLRACGVSGETIRDMEFAIGRYVRKEL